MTVPLRIISIILKKTTGSFLLFCILKQHRGETQGCGYHPVKHFLVEPSVAIVKALPLMLNRELNSVTEVNMPRQSITTSAKAV